jgi:ParB family chromosome partitioning protein
MQDFFFHPPKISEKESEAPIFLHPEQIYTPGGAKTPSKSINSIIRLAESIKKYGILEPLTVKIVTGPSGSPVYEIVSGKKRLQAAISVGITRIPCTIQANHGQNSTVAGILDSLKRESLNIFEQAATFKMLIDNYNLTQEKLARNTGVSQSSIANKLRLLQLSKEEQRRILAAGLSERHARALLRLKVPDLRAEALRQVIAERMSVSATEQFIESLREKEQESHREPAVSVVLAPETPPKGITPRKFALRDLTPLYNSIDRILSIFRKTGASVLCKREESPNGVRIIIEIPK